MNITAVQSLNAAAQAVFLFEDETSSIEAINKAISKGLFTGKLASTLPVNDGETLYIAVGLGKKDKLKTTATRKAVDALFKALKSLSVTQFAVDTSKLGDDAVRVFTEALINSSYHFDALKSDKDSYQLSEIQILADDIKKAQHDISIASAIANGQNYAKDLKNFPANVCNTDYLLNEAKKLAEKNNNVTLHYLDEKKMYELGMGCITAVGQGSKMPSYIACMEYYGAEDKSQKPIVLVGKGLVYDTGGLCLKPWQGMATMKMDMGGAAAVFGTMKAITDLNLPVNVIGVVALVENSIDGASFRPGDVLKSMKGITVEVGNTDAEGRLALCDALTYIEKYNPEVVIDVATLTGAMVISLGGKISGLFGNDDKLVEALKDASKEAKDPAWHLPLFEDYHEQLKSEVADMNNIGGPAAGSITAALFLSRFTEDYRWAHLDVAGSAMGGFDKATASGRPVPLLTQYILDQVN